MRSRQGEPRRTRFGIFLNDCWTVEGNEKEDAGNHKEFLLLGLSRRYEAASFGSV